MKQAENGIRSAQTYTRNIYRVILIAITSIFLAVTITGVLGYNVTKKSVIKKLKYQDLVFIVKSMSSLIQGRINRAVETSDILAKDPFNISWIKGREKDKKLGKLVLDKLNDGVHSYDYSNFFEVGVKTRHYYYVENDSKRGQKIEYVTLSKNNPKDAWFFDMLKAKKNMELNVNYDRAMNNTFLFVNALIGSKEQPLGICGVGLSLADVSKEFKRFKVGNTSNLWLIDEKGIIQLSDKTKNVGENCSKFLNSAVMKNIKLNSVKASNNIKVAQYVNREGKTIDYAYCRLSSTNWTLFYQIPRQDSLAMLSALKENIIITSTLVLILFMILFYFISKKIANPYKQVMLVNEELEIMVDSRTAELKESNDKIIYSIEYAKTLQESILPDKNEMNAIFKDYFVIWKPRDIVGGDFYWIKKFEDVMVLAVGDCTGHGVPGALMTMTVNAILHNIVDTENRYDPGLIMKELHIRLKETLNKNSTSSRVDDGLDVGIFCIRGKNQIMYAGANIELYIKNGGEVEVLKPQTRGIGYNYIEMKEKFSNYSIQAKKDSIFIISSDGLIHQNGGEKNYPFGKKRLSSLIQDSKALNLELMKKEFVSSLEQYMQGNEQRDDITVMAFRIE